jgi:hypothetical protein
MKDAVQEVTRQAIRILAEALVAVRGLTAGDSLTISALPATLSAKKTGVDEQKPLI